jgi:hypothetical protein
MYFFSSFKITGLTLRSLIHFQVCLFVCFVQSKRKGSSINLLHVDIHVSPAPLIKEAAFFFQCMLLVPLPRISWQYFLGLFSGSSVYYICTCLFLFQYYATFDIMAPWYSLKSCIVLFTRDCFFYLGSFVFPYGLLDFLYI